MALEISVGEGSYKLTVDPGDGSNVEVFYGIEP